MRDVVLLKIVLSCGAWESSVIPCLEGVFL